jgi:hypothetical protein
MDISQIERLLLLNLAFHYAILILWFGAEVPPVLVPRVF